MKKRKISVALPSLDRPKLLLEALISINKLKIPDGFAIDVVVIDNSSDGFLKKIYDRNLPEEIAGISMKVIHEPARGISAARNAGLTQSIFDGADYVLFTDDDVILNPDWLCQVLELQHLKNADAVVGYVQPRAKKIIPWWVRAAHDIDFRQYQNGSSIDFGYTCGSIVKLDYVVNKKIRFDSLYGVSGGEDSDFFEKIYRAGGKIVFSQNAVSYESYDGARFTVIWWLRRWFRDGNSSGIRFAQLERRLSRTERMYKGMLRISLGIPIVVLSAPLIIFKSNLMLRGLRAICRGGGLVSSVFGYRFNEYSNKRIRRES